MSFQGFPKGGERFFQELAAEMSREWFAAHKAEYEELWLRPMEALLDDVRARASRAYARLGLTEPKVFRIHRDVRFARDKAPYKTHIAGCILVGRGKASADGITSRPAALYVSFGSDEFSGAGAWMLGPEQLVRWRKSLLDKKKGGEIARLLAAARARTWDIEAHEELTRVPRGFPPEHPLADLARKKGISVGFPPIPRGLIYKPALADWLAERAAQAAPLCAWIVANVR